MRPNRARVQVTPLPVRVRRTQPVPGRRVLLVLTLALVQAVNSELFPFLRVQMARAKGLKGSPEPNKQARGRVRILVRVLVGNLVFPVGSKGQGKAAIAQQVT